MVCERTYWDQPFLLQTRIALKYFYMNMHWIVHSNNFKGDIKVIFGMEMNFLERIIRLRGEGNIIAFSEMEHSRPVGINFASSWYKRHCTHCTHVQAPLQKWSRHADSSFEHLTDVMFAKWTYLDVVFVSHDISKLQYCTRYRCWEQVVRGVRIKVKSRLDGYYFR